ncbi:MAG: hypothetical protein AAF198_11005 [Pseudomonadota bacterium]
MNRETHLFSSPYEPLDRPETHHLAYSRKERIFSASITSGMPNIQFHFKNGGGIGFENSTELGTEDELLSFEIHRVSKGISLATKAVGDGRAEELRSEKLWRGLRSHDEVEALGFFDNWYEWVGKNGAFWKEWYQGVLDGEPLDWELQRKIALIPNQIWDTGIEAVAEEIERIRATLDLEKKIAELEDELRIASLNRRGIGGNMPPEPIADTIVAEELKVIGQPLEDLKSEASKEEPSKKALEVLAEQLTKALKHGLSWALKKTDLAIDTIIRWAIPAGGTGYFALNPDKLEAVIEAVMKLIALI